MVVSQTTSKFKATKHDPICKLKESIESESQYQYNEFKRRHKALAMEQSRSKYPIKIIVAAVTLILCVVNVFWGVSSSLPFIPGLKSLKTKATDTSESQNPLLSLSSMIRELPSKRRGSDEKNLAKALSSTPHTFGNQERSQDNIVVLPAVNRQVGKMAAAKNTPLHDPKPVPTSRRKVKKPRPHMPPTEDQTIPIYYVNLDTAVDRRAYIESHLREKNLQAVRVAAVDSSENVTVSLVSPLTMVHPNDRELACIASHMIAIHRAVNEKTFFPSSPYAIIIEDDVRLEFSINWNDLLYNAPEDFDVLQLMTSNSDQVLAMLKYYERTVNSLLTVQEGRNETTADSTKHEYLWSPRMRGSSLWSTQAYAIRKDYVRRIINTLVKRDDVSGEYSVSIKNTPNQATYCKETNARSCKLLYPFRLVADIYLYDLLGVAYTMRLPLLNGAFGYNSSIQSESGEDKMNNSFSVIGGAVNYLRSNSDNLLPSRLLLKTAKETV